MRRAELYTFASTVLLLGNVLGLMLVFRPRCLSCRRLGGSFSRCETGVGDKHRAAAGNRAPAIDPVARYYTDGAMDYNCCAGGRREWIWVRK
jgi:hypothetical protein